MIGMNVHLCNGTSCLRMFSPWTLIFGALSPFFMRLGTFILDAEVHTSFERLLGSSWFAIFHQFMTYLKEQIAITALTIRKDTEIMSMSCSATRQGWSKGIGGGDAFMKLCVSSSGCKARPARGEPAQAGSEPGDGLRNGTGEA